MSSARATICLLVTVAPGANAQRNPLPRFCEVPQEGCWGTVVTETLIGIHNHGVETALTVGFEGALMQNNARGAFGLGAYWAYQSHGYRWGIKPRLRRWLTQQVALDASAGLLLNSGEDRFSPSHPGYVVQLNVAVRGTHGAMLRAEFLNDGAGNSTTDLTLGGQIGERPGATVGMLLLLLVGLTEIAKASYGDRIYVP